ncbi:MAG: ABC transporter ATP-binding protein/permease [Coriobacteriia bacterium]|nr:ABC transporter ATP-binding protein/permease [Coriobacteriia bacterium]
MSDSTEKVEQPKREARPMGPRFGGGHMSGPVEKPADFWGTTKKLFALLGPDRFKLLLASLFSIAAVSCVVAGPKVMALATNRLADGVADIMKAQAMGATEIPSIDFAYIGRIALILVALYCLGALLAYIQQTLTVTVTQDLVRTLRRMISEKLDHLPLSFFDTQTYGEILSKITIDADLISTNLQQAMTQTMTSLFTLIGIIIMMFTISWKLALVSLIAVPGSILVTALIAPRSQKFFADQQAQLGDLNGQIEENFAGHIIVKAFNREEANIARFDETNEELFGSAWRAQFMSSIIMPLIHFISNVQYVVIVVYAAILSAAGQLPIGDILAFIQYIQQFGQPIQQVAQIANVIQGTIAAAERVFTLLEEPEETADSEVPALLDEPKGLVEFKDIDFDYVQTNPLIRDLSLTAKPGQTVAIVGPTGAGKTTLVNLLMRFYDLNSGEILVDGVNTADMSRHDVRKLFGMVLQDTWLFNGTIAENIAYGRDGATREEVEAAAKAAFADHFIRTLPQGYDTILAEDGSNLSVGQRQLLTIARAILADSPIMILDEATSSVDTRTERLIQEAMNRLTEGRTSFVIAHRLSTIRDADLILVMDKGRVVESGTHEELLAADGFYADLYNSQFSEEAEAA